MRRSQTIFDINRRTIVEGTPRIIICEIIISLVQGRICYDSSIYKLEENTIQK